MGELIKNVFVKVTKNSVKLISGKIGYQKVIKRFVLNNKATKAASINVFMMDGEQKHYLERNISVIPNSKLELFNNKSIILNRNDGIFIESLKTGDIDVICDYIEKPLTFQDICILFTDQHGENVDDIIYTTTNSPSEINRKVITFIDNENYLSLLPITFDVKSNQITVFKTNNIDVVSEYGCVETAGMFVVNLFQTNYASIDSVGGSAFIRVNITQEDEYWQYTSITSTTSGSSGTTSDLLNQDEIYTIPASEIEIIAESDEFGELNFTFDALRNNFYDFKLDFDNEISDPTSVAILKSDFISDDDALGIRWRIVGFTETLNYDDVVEDLAEGTYTIEIQELNNYFNTIIDEINVYENQRTNYQINDELVRQTYPSNNIISPENITIAIEVIKKPVLSITVQPSGTDGITDATWRLKYPSGIYTEWKDQNKTIKIGSENYQIEFGEVDGYLKPSTYSIIIPMSTISLTINVVYTKTNTSRLTINFSIPNKYVRYLSWCIVKPDDELEIFYVNWNNSIKYDEIIPNGKYELKIKEVVFGETVGIDIYDSETGIIVPNRILIEEQTIDINLTIDEVINISLITEGNTE